MSSSPLNSSSGSPSPLYIPPLVLPEVEQLTLEQPSPILDQRSTSTPPSPTPTPDPVQSPSTGEQELDPNLSHSSSSSFPVAPTFLPTQFPRFDDLEIDLNSSLPSSSSSSTSDFPGRRGSPFRSSPSRGSYSRSGTPVPSSPSSLHHISSSSSARSSPFSLSATSLPSPVHSDSSGRSSPFFSRSSSPNSSGSSSPAFGEDLTECDIHNFRILYVIYKKMRSTKLSEVKFCLMAEGPNLMIIPVDKSAPKPEISDSEMVIINHLVNKISQPMMGYSDPLSLSKGLYYLHKMQRWLPLIVGQDKFKEIQFPPLTRGIGLPSQTRFLTGNGFENWNEEEMRQSERDAATKEREAFEAENPGFYSEMGYESIQLIKQELDSSKEKLAELLTMKQNDQLGPRGLEFLKLLEVEKIPRLVKLLNYHFFLYQKLTAHLSQDEASEEDEFAQQLMLEMHGLAQQIEKNPVPIGSGLNNPVINYAKTIVPMSKLSSSSSSSPPAQLLGLKLNSPSRSGDMIAVSVEKPATDLGFDEGSWAGTHEMLAYQLASQFFKGGLVHTAPCVFTHNPFLSPVADSTCTQHAFIKNKGTAMQIEKERPLLLSPDNVRKVLIFTLLLNQVDAHEGNFIVKKDMHGKDELIPIDSGRMLLSDPLSDDAILRSSVFIKWLNAIEKSKGGKALQFSAEEKKLILEIDPESLAAFVKGVVGYDSMTDLQRKVWDRKILHLQANLTLLKFAMDKGLSAKELLVMKMPPLGITLTREDKRQLGAIIREKNREERDQASRQFNLGVGVKSPLPAFRSVVAYNHYFENAWNQSLLLGPVDSATFLAKFYSVLEGNVSFLKNDAKKVFKDIHVPQILRDFGL